MPRLLIVDDETSIRTMFARSLRSFGDIDEADGGADAMRKLEVTPYDVILLDLNMPGVDGHAVLKALHVSKGPNRKTPVVVITADMTDQARASAFAGGAIYYLPKPVSMASMMLLVGSAMKKAGTK